MTLMSSFCGFSTTKSINSCNVEISIANVLLPMCSLGVTLFLVWAIGKVTVLKVLKSSEKSLSKLDSTEEHDDDIKNQYTLFIASYYGYPQETDITSP